MWMFADSSGGGSPSPGQGERQDPLAQLAAAAEQHSSGPRRRRRPARIEGANIPAIASLVLGIACFALPVLAYLNTRMLPLAMFGVLVCAIVGTICGLVGYQAAKRGASGRTIAIAGTILSSAPMIITLLIARARRYF